MNPLDPPNAYVVAPSDADWSGNWLGNGPYSSWIAANPNDATGNGLMTFTDTFNVATPSTAVIIGGAWAIDDQGTLSLNGHLLSTVPNHAFGHLTAFSTTASDFVAGSNTLTMVVTKTDFFLEGARLRAISERTESTGFPRALGLRGHPKSSFARMMQLDRSLL